MKMTDLHDLLKNELDDLYSAEKQIIKALPKLVKAASSPALKAAFQAHLAQTEVHVTRLDQVFGQLNLKPGRKKCEGMEGLLKEGDSLIAEKPSPDVLDAGLIAAAQRVEHYEMAGYGCVRTYARLMGHDEAARILQTTLDEEGDADKKLTRLAETGINLEAMDGPEPMDGKMTAGARSGPGGKSMPRSSSNGSSSNGSSSNGSGSNGSGSKMAIGKSPAASGARSGMGKSMAGSNAPSVTGKATSSNKAAGSGRPSTDRG